MGMKRIMLIGQQAFNIISGFTPDAWREKKMGSKGVEPYNRLPITDQVKKMNDLNVLSTSGHP